ncbi:C-terminal binding protein [Oscillospiraceae bacterium MB08-C2-2]|nr:C-terminal binding protein [Oscillospiraceae bacterium MB08-C2-2]
MQLKAVITEYEYPDVNIEREIIEKAGFAFEEYQAKTEDELIEATRDAHAVIVQYAEITPRVIEHMQNCKMIVKYGIGINNIHYQAATEKGIYICNIPDYGVEEVANHAVAGIMALARKITISDKTLRGGYWGSGKLEPVRRLSNSTVGIIGCGRIGGTVAQRMKAFGVRVIAWDNRAESLADQNPGVEFVDFETLLKESDYISIHCPLDDNTKYLIDAQAIAKMKPTTFIINTARGPIIRESDLIEALQTGKLAGASLDVFESEPVSQENPLLTMENVIVSPHTAWYSMEGITALHTKAATEAVNVLQGNLPFNLCNPEVLKEHSHSL